MDINSKKILSIVTLGMLVASCADFDGDFTRSELSQIKLEESYAKNFIAEYGDLSDVKSWDLTRLGSKLNDIGNLTRAGHVVSPEDIEAYTDTRSTSAFRQDAPGGYTYSFVPLEGTEATTDDEIAAIRSNTTVAAMSADGNTYPAGDYYYVPNGLLGWYNGQFTNKVEHTYEYSKNGYEVGENYSPVEGCGTRIRLPKPTHDFWIVPVFQDVVWTCWDLHMVCNGKDYKIWSKGQGVEIQPATHKFTFHLQLEPSKKLANGNWAFVGDEANIFEYDLIQNVQSTLKYYDNVVWEPELIAKSQNTTNGKYLYVYKVDDTRTAFFADANDLSVTRDGKEYVQITLPKAGQGINKVNDIYRIYTKSIEQGEGVVTTESEKLKEFFALDEGDRPLKAKWNTMSDPNANYSQVNQQTRSKPIKINASAINTDITFYLEITHGEWKKKDGVLSGACFPGTKQCSDEGMMSFFPYTGKTYDFSAITGSATSSAMFLGIEDGNMTSDYDYNDAAFLLLGLDEITETVQRRYLCEDLGSTYDFDFNDIVVDATQEITYDVANSAKSTSRTPKSVKQDFSIAHMCGTLPFQVSFGSSTLATKMNPNISNGKTTGYTPTSSEANNYKWSWTSSSTPTFIGDSKIAINGAPWNPLTHNIMINVWQNAKSLDEATGNASNSNVVIHTVSFGDYDPKKEGGNTLGNNIPQIIAVDPSVNWMGESKHIPQAWIDAAKTTNIK